MSEDDVEWRPVAEHQHRYEVSSVGVVRRVDSGELLKAYPTSKGYLSVWFRETAKPRTATVHSLVAAAFHGSRPKGLVVNHKDADKRNNHFTNLEYVTHRQNLQHAADLGLSPHVKLNEGLVHAIRVSTLSHVQLARQHKVSPDTIKQARNSKTWPQVQTPTLYNWNAGRRLTSDQVRAIRASVERHTALARAYNVSEGVIRSARYGTLYRDVPFPVGYSPPRFRKPRRSREEIDAERRHSVTPCPKGYCKQGHSLTPDNVLTDRNGHRKCKICERARKKVRNARRYRTKAPILSS